MDSATSYMVQRPGDEAAVRRGCRFNARKADHVVAFFEQHLRHTLGRWAGKPLELMPWQRDEVLRPLFGWERADGTRRFRQAYIEIPKKNGKSTMCSGLALYLLAADGEPGAQVYCAAADREQAGIVYREASAMAKASPLLKKYIVPRDSTKNLAIPSANAFLRAISRESFTAEGLNIHGLIFDELHAQRARDLWDALRYGGASRKQPLLIAITTAGYDRNSICWEQHDRAQKILDGVIEDDSFFAYIRAAGKDDDWTSPETWRKANPSLGVTIDIADMEQACREAQETPAAENSFRRYRLNQWTEQESRWISMERWDACEGEVDAEALLGHECYAGLDLGSSDDISALVLVFPSTDGRRKLLPFFWVPGESAHRREQKDRVPYATWGRKGFVELTGRRQTDYDVIRSKILELSKRYDIRDVAFDPWNALQLSNQLAEDGIQMVEFRQTMANLAGPTKEFERLIIDGLLDHGRNPVLRWMASNVSVVSDVAGNVRPNKDRKREKIDGIVAAIMGLARCSMAAGNGVSIYEEREPLLL